MTSIIRTRVPRALQLKYRTTTLQTRSYSQLNQAPSEQATNLSGTTTTTKTSSNLPVILVALALVGGGTYYYLSSDPTVRSKVHSDLSQVEDKTSRAIHDAASHTLSSAQSQLEGKLSHAGDKATEIKERAKAELERQRDHLGGSKVDPVVLEGLRRSDEATGSRGWFAGSRADVKLDKERLEREARGEWDKVKSQTTSVGQEVMDKGDELAEKGRKKAEEIKQEGKGWFNWGSSKASDAKAKVTETYDSAVSLAEDTKDSALSYASEKKHDAASVVKDTQAEASSWWSWGSRKTKEAVKGAEEGVGAVGDKVNDGIVAVGDKIYDAGVGAKEAVVGGSREAKETLKDGLLKVERETELGARKAQEKTREL
ncbi:hypothetical protein T439DRAFT_375766 [Meredithblackwellia eburnea MCA 4105]